MSEVVITGLIAAFGLLAYGISTEDKKKENYNDLPSNEQLGETQKLTVGNFSNYAFSRPNFKAGPTPRFDPYRTASGTVRDRESNFPAGSYVSSFGTQAAESYPITDAMMQGAEEAADYTTIADMKFNDQEYQTECKKSAGIRQQYKSMKDVNGMGGYTDPSEMLPAPSARSCIIEDARNPTVFSAGNTIGFKSRGGRAARSLHDHIRGDLYIDPAPILTMPMNISTSTISGGAINSGIIAEAPRVSDPQYSYGKDTQLYQYGHKFGTSSGEYPIDEIDQMALSGATPGTLYTNKDYLNDPWGDLQSKQV